MHSNQKSIINQGGQCQSRTRHGGRTVRARFVAMVPLSRTNNLFPAVQRGAEEVVILQREFDHGSE